ncbi:hypothetical protein M5D96_011971, partial [Drosophila gunungcola]
FEFKFKFKSYERKNPRWLRWRAGVVIDSMAALLFHLKGTSTVLPQLEDVVDRDVRQLTGQAIDRGLNGCSGFVPHVTQEPTRGVSRGVVSSSAVVLDLLQWRHNCSSRQEGSVEQHISRCLHQLSFRSPAPSLPPRLRTALERYGLVSFSLSFKPSSSC